MKKLFFVFVLTVFGCPKPPPSAPGNAAVHCEDESREPQTFSNDKSAEAQEQKTPCARACANLFKHRCVESEKLEGGKSCIRNCTDFTAISSFDPECVAAASSPDAIRKCPSASCTQ